MPKILDYNTLTTTAGCNVLFIGDKNSSITNPEIKNITVENLFKRETFYALNANGLKFYDDGGTVALYIKDGGQVGVGAASTSHNLQVNGTFNVTGSAYFDGSIYDSSNSAGTNGQVLTSTGAGGTAWSTISSGGGLTGGTQCAIPVWTSTTTIGSSSINDVGGNIGIGMASAATNPNTKLTIRNDSSRTDYINFTDTGGSATCFYISRNNSQNAIGLGSVNTGPSATTFNVKSNGFIGVNVAINSMNYPLNVCETNSSGTGIIANLSSAAAKSILLFANSNSAQYSNVVSYSNNDGSNQITNWLTGTFKDGSNNKYFGVHYKNSTFSSSEASFDTSTLSNNLFYIDTSGNTNIKNNISVGNNATVQGSVSTHNTATTGHNDGRFVQVFTHPLKCFNNTSITAYMPAINIDPRIDSYSSITDPNSGNPYPETSDEMAKSVMPYAGKLIAAYGNFNVDAIAQGATCLSFESSNNGVNAGYLTASFDSASASDNCILTFGIDSSSESYLEFTAGSTATIAWCAPSGRYNGASLTFVYEFDIT